MQLRLERFCWQVWEQMHLKTSSNLYGATIYPFNRSLTAGGSSGGEGALVGLCGSCLGIGRTLVSKAS